MPTYAITTQARDGTGYRLLGRVRTLRAIPAVIARNRGAVDTYTQGVRVSDGEHEWLIYEYALDKQGRGYHQLTAYTDEGDRVVIHEEPDPAPYGSLPYRE